MGIFTKLNKSQIKDILANFKSLPKQDFKFAGVEIGTVNTFYKLTFTDQKKSVFYLKIDEIADETRLKNEIKIFQLLAKHHHRLSYEVPLPIQTRAGKLYLKLNGQFFLLFREIAGRSLYDELKPNHLRLMGQKLAELHKLPISKAIKPHRFSFNGLHKTFIKIRPALKSRHPQIADMLTKEFKTIKSQLGKSSKQVLIHADLFPENVLWIKNHFSGMLDFEAGGLGDALFDIGVCVHALCLNDENKLDTGKFKAFLTGYQSIHRISKDEQKKFPLYLKLTCLRFLVTRLKDFELRNVSPKLANFKNYRVYLNRYTQIESLIRATQL